ncbi:MAG: ArsA family ATPase [Myxococcota bacterium]
MRLVLYTGKGGVGKTTTAAATALCAAQRGRRTLLASVDAAHSLGDVLERRLGPQPTEVAPRLDALEVDARVETARHWGHIKNFLISIFRHQGIEAVVAEELALLPGAEELTTLLAVEEYARQGSYDFAVVDCAPTDATLRLVTLPEVAHGALRLLLYIQQAITSVVTPLARNVVSVPLPDAQVFREAERLLYGKLRPLRQRLTDRQTSVRIVVTPERMAIDEARRAYTELALFEVPCDAVVINRLLPKAAADEAFFRDWGRLQEQRRSEVAELFAPLPVLEAPLQDDEVTGLERLAEHGRQIFANRRPDAVLSRAPRVRFGRDQSGYRVVIPLPRVERGAFDVARVDDELVITTAARRRALVLPRRMASLPVAGARIEGASLVVRFASRADSGAV